ncbi:MAG: hypothetical protein ACXAD7_28510, partial [Candidatus Kariarchaeaceae archaeon]
FSTSWTSGNIGINIDGLSVGVYNYTIVVFDKSGNYANDTVFVNVIDIYNPLINSPTDFNYIEGTPGNSISWNGTDDYPENYFIYQNTTLNATGSWLSGVPIVYNIDGRMKGIYNFTIVLFDSSGNSVSDTVMVTITDEDLPTISNPSNILYALGSTGNELQWTASDNHPDIYEIYRNGSQINSSNWISGSPIIINIDGLAIGDYNFTIIVFDDSGNSNADLVWVTVADGTALSVSAPEDIQYAEGSVGNEIEWMPIDDFPDNYTIFFEGSEVESDYWSSGIKINYSIDGLSIGRYNYTIIVYDTSRNFVVDTVMVDVFDGTYPSFTISQGNIIYNEGSGSNFLNWTATDAHSANYTIFRNGSQIDSGDWTSGISININIDGLSKGVYNFTIVVRDESLNQETDTAIVTVIDNTLPMFTYVASDVQFAEGSSGNSLNWTVTDLYPNYYEIYHNNSLMEFNNWNSSVPIIYDIDSLTKGLYNITIVVYDDSMNFRTNSVNVTVIDNTTPLLSSPSDVEYKVGAINNFIVWTASDNYPNNFSIYRNSIVIFSGIWISGDININIDGLGVGVYNYTILVQDKSGNSAVDTVDVEVKIDSVAPVLVAQPNDFSYSEGSQGDFINWTAIHNSPDIYMVYLDGEIITIKPWTNNTEVSINVNGHVIGDYNYTIVVYETNSNSTQFTIMVTVFDNTSPYLVEDLNGDPVNIVFGGPGYELVWTVTDNYP